MVVVHQRFDELELVCKHSGLTGKKIEPATEGGQELKHWNT